MSRNTRSTNRRSSAKQIIAEKSHQLIQKLRETECIQLHNSKSSVDCSSHLSVLKNFIRSNGPLMEKPRRHQRDDVEKQKSNLQKKRLVSIGRTTVPITPQMIRDAVKELQTRRVYISSILIASHLRRRYPIENDPDALKEELNEKLNCAVSVGLIARCGDDKYCIPTLRQQASLNKTALTSFWDTYYKNGAPSTVEQFHTLRMPVTRAYKKSGNVSPKRSYGNRDNNYQDPD